MLVSAGDQVTQKAHMEKYQAVCLRNTAALRLEL
jgi:hypothetical protein